MGVTGARSSERTDRFVLVGTNEVNDLEELAASVRAGLTEPRKQLDSIWLYDEQGSQLSGEICALPEYYLTRAEREIIAHHAPEILCDRPVGMTLVELGSGNAVNTCILIDELLRRSPFLRYVPIDISATMLETSSRQLLREYPGLEVRGLAMEYVAGLREMRQSIHGPKLVLWLGSNVGSFDRAGATTFLREVRNGLTADDRFLLGVDLRKEVSTLEQAYDDATGVTERFNKNLLARINRDLEGDFDLDAFDHRAVYDEDEGHVDLFLVSRFEQMVNIKGLDLAVHFDAGETIHTESSYKYSLREIDRLVEESAFRIGGQWFDAAERFVLNRLAPA